MPLDGGLSSGVTNTLTFVDQNGNVNFTGIESFTAKEDAPTERFIQMNGVVSNPQFPHGWSGSFMIGRKGNFMDNYIAAKESDYYANGNQITMTITQTIKESDGSISQYQYLGVVITLDSAGDWTGTSIVKQSVSYVASRRIKIA